jgi:hypothetical protein
MKKVFSVVMVVFAMFLFGALYEVRSQDQRIRAIEGRLGGQDRAVCDPSDSVGRARQSVVRIVGGETEGTGFAIKEGGFILTNHHVIEFEPSPKVILSNGLFYTGKIVLTNKSADLAVIKIDRNLPIIPLRSAKWLKPAEELYVIGYALGGVISGEATVTKGLFSGLRYSEENDMAFIQTDASMMPGVSGGPMIDVCGEAVGVNTAGIFNLNLGIAADTIRRKILASASDTNPAPDVQEFTFNPGKSPHESVRAFYNYLKARRLEKAFEVLSDNFVRGYSFEDWAQGYRPLLDTTIVDIAPDLEVENRIRVKLATKDLIGEDIVTRYFEGYWDTRLVDGRWLLWDPEIREIEEPGEEWHETTKEKVEQIREELGSGAKDSSQDSPITAKSFVATRAGKMQLTHSIS